ncbi:hypothetical protein RHGRI_027354 [Rhododendron griersonianum]|uniref:Uncharacterized protein n=1 Tax=Rhododendron griersonianum TaxID=479676 RepID=A0AAV6IWZ8_9ERIC|nr:hypothetical protein RHGRI_027354 [Rhododendron griersonianum]
MDALYFDIAVYFRGYVSRIKNVNPGRYTYVDLLDDVAEKSLSTIPCGNGCTITLRSKIPESNETMVVSCDLDVLDMFRFNSRTCQIELTVDVGEDGGTLEVGGQEVVRNDVRAHDVIDLSDNVVEGLTSEAHNVQRIENVGEGSTVGQFKSVRKRNNVTRREHDDYLASLDSDEDGSLGDQSEHSDEDFINDSDQSEHSDEDYSFSSANEDSGSSTDGFSSYESDNEDGRDSSDEEGKTKKE